jgi:hypothetical protein
VSWSVFLSLAWLILLFVPQRALRLSSVGLLVLILFVGIG